MSKQAKRKDLFTASEVARFCQVDLKTIHNWADRGEIQHFRTPGRHLRFRQLDVLDFLRKYGYPIPEAVADGRPRLYTVERGDEGSLPGLEEVGEVFEVTVFPDALACLLAVGDAAPDALLVHEDMQGARPVDVIRAIKANAATQHVRAVILSSSVALKAPALAAGASAFMSPEELGSLRGTLEALMGLARVA